MAMTGNRGGGYRRWLGRIGVDIRPGEDAPAWLLFLGFFLVITFQYLAKAVRQSTFIDSLGATRLPFVYLMVALCSWPLLRLYVRAAGAVPRHRLIVITCLLILAGTVVFWWLFGYPWIWVRVAFYIWASIAFVLTASQFWSFATHLLDPRQAKRLLGFVGAGGLLGGIAGGQLARLASTAVGTRGTLLVAGALTIGIAALAEIAHRSHPPGEPHGPAPDEAGDASLDGLAIVRRSGYLRLVGALLVIGVMVSQVVDLQFNWAVENATTGLAQRTAWFGNIFSLAGIAAFLFQIVFTARIHRTLGVGFAMRVLPVTVLVGTAAVLLAAGLLPEWLLAACIVLKLGENGMRYSIDQSTRELLFMPLPSGVRVKAKAFIDVFTQRAAEGAAALLLLPVSFGLFSPAQAGWLTIGLGLVWLVVAAAAYRSYVGSFRTGLRDRTLDAAVVVNLDDVRTVEVMVQSLGSTDPRQVLHSLDILAANGRGGLVPPLLLYHDDAEVRQRTLQVLVEAGRRDALPLVERRLGDDSPDVRAEAIRVLTAFNATDACAMMAPRLGEGDPKVRAAAITCLITHGGDGEKDRATRALEDMLQDGDAERRAEAVKAMGALPAGAFEGRLVRAMDDRDPRVAREAIRAVQRRVARDGFNAVFLPRMISLLQNRRLKQDAREALVDFGPDAVPILVHFLDDPGESIFVRRALARSIALIGGPAAIASLVRSLKSTEDALVRLQIVEALSARRDDVAACGASAAIEEAIREEAGRYLERLAEISACGDRAALVFDGPVVRKDRREMNLVVQMLAERIEESVRTIFGLLALLYPPVDVWAAYRSLVSSRRALRNYALEYLENTLAGDVRRHVFAAIGDAPLAEKLRAGARLYGTTSPARAAAIARFLKDGPGEGDRALCVAAMYTVHAEGMSDLYPRVEAVGREAQDPLVLETAAWVVRRLGLERR